MVLRSEKSLRGAELCMSQMCKEGEGGNEDGGVEGPRLVVNGGMLEEVELFCYLGAMLDRDAGVKTTV